MYLICILMFWALTTNNFVHLQTVVDNFMPLRLLPFFLLLWLVSFRLKIWRKEKKFYIQLWDMIPSSLEKIWTSSSSMSYLVILLDVVFKVSSVNEAFSTLITRMVASCQTHPPVKQKTIKSRKYGQIEHLPFYSVFMDAKKFPSSDNSDLFHLFQHFQLERVWKPLGFLQFYDIMISSMSF